MESFNFMIRRATLCSGVTISALMFLSPSQSCEVQVVKYMENKQGEGIPLTEIYEEVSKELRVPLGNMSRWWRNKDKSSRHLSDVDASQCIAVLSPSQSCCHSLWSASLMIHSALLCCHPPNLDVMVYYSQV